MGDYIPIGCGAYDEIEVMALHREWVTLQVLDQAGSERELEGRVADTAIRGGAEYLVLESAGERVLVRLDRIATIHRRDTGGTWRQ